MHRYSLDQLRGAWGAGKHGADRAPKPAMVGRFFHTVTENGELDRQGQIVSAEQDGYYMAQLYDAFGERSRQELVHFSRMVDWHFYAPY